MGDFCIQDFEAAFPYQPQHTAFMHVSGLPDFQGIPKNISNKSYGPCCKKKSTPFMDRHMV